MLFKKITEGCVIQTFNDAGECISQEFIAGDDVEYETDCGYAINAEDMPDGMSTYHPYDMVQPGEI